MTLTETDRPKTTNGVRSLPALGIDAEAPRTPRRSRIPQALLAALLIVGGGVLASMLFQRYNTRSDVVVVTEAVSAGQRLDVDSLAITDAALGSGIGQPVRSLNDAAGSYASHDLEPGDLVTANDLTDERLMVNADQLVIGIVVEPGGYPTREIGAGDVVDVFTPTTDDGEVNLAPLAENVAMQNVQPVSRDGDTLLISLIVTREEAATIINAEADEGIRLGLHGDSK